MSYNSVWIPTTWREHPTHRYKGSVLHNHPTSDTSHRYQVPRLPVFLSDLAPHSGVPTTPTLLGSLEQQLTELRKALYLPLRVYHKGHNSGTAIQKSCTGQGVWGGGAQSFHILSGCHPPGITQCSPTQLFGGFMQVSLPKHD